MDNELVDAVARAIYQKDRIVEFYERGPGDPPGNRYVTWEELPQGLRDRVTGQAQAALAATPLKAENEALRELLRRIEPHLDAIICYASTMDEHEPNRIASDVRAALTKQGG